MDFDQEIDHECDRELKSTIQRYKELLGTPEEILRRIEELESERNYCWAYDIAYEATRFKVIDLTDKLEELGKKIDAQQKELLDANPMGETVIQTNGLFRSVCCQKLKDAILAKKIEVTADCMTNIPSLVVVGPEMMTCLFGKEYEGTSEDDWGETSCCPYCGKEIYDYFVE